MNWFSFTLFYLIYLTSPNSSFQFLNKVLDKTVCQGYNVECCLPSAIPANIDGLAEELEKSLHGQHIIIQELIPALKGHFMQDLNSNTNPKKPLVLSFHGTGGVGKNFVADYIAKFIYFFGLNSKFVHKFNRASYAFDHKTEQYKVELGELIEKEIKKCPYSLFIFDEIDDIPKGVFETITTFLEHRGIEKGVDYSKAIYIFLTNVGGVEIGDDLYTFVKKWGADRQQTKLHDFERALEGAAYNLANGLQGGKLLEKHLVDHFFPFLPLEKPHVRKCIMDEYRKHNVEPKEESVNYILDKFVTYDPVYKIYSTSGCKRLDSKVRLDVAANYKKNDKEL